MRKFTTAFLRTPNRSFHSHAFLERDRPSLIFSTLASTPPAAEVGAGKPDVSRTANGRKVRELKADKLRCMSLHADIPSAKAKRKAKATATQLSDIGVFKAEGVIVLEEETAAQMAATGQAEDAALHAKFVFEVEKAVQNAAIERSEEVASESIANAKKELSEWAAKLDLNTFKRGCQWEETAYKLLDHGISSAHLKKMLPKCRALPCIKNSPDTILQHFKMLGMSHEEMGRVISLYPSILNISNHIFQSKVEFFESIGIDKRSLGKIMHKAFRVIGLSSSTLRRRCNFWKDYLQDAQENALLTLISKNPRILTYNMQLTVKPSIAFLEKLGFNKKMLLNDSTILGLRVEAIAMKLKLFEQFGISTARHCIMALTALHDVSALKLHARLHNLLALGFSFDQVQKIMMGYPRVLCLTEDHINVRLSYAVNVMNLSFDMIASFPVFWGYSFEKRIEYRYGVLQELKSLGAYEKNISLSYMVSMTDTAFSRRFIKRLQAYTKHSNI